MSQSLSRSALQTVALSKISDALLLFENGRFSSAYYIAGYAIECALKSCIAKQMISETIPDRKLINSIYVHSFPDLIGVAGMRGILKERQDGDPIFHANWGIVTEWNPEIRYGSVDESTADYFLVAVASPEHGVLEWIKKYW